MSDEEEWGLMWLLAFGAPVLQYVYMLMCFQEWIVIELAIESGRLARETNLGILQSFSTYTYVGQQDCFCTPYILKFFFLMCRL